MRCGCGNELMTGDFEGICIRCRNAMNQAKQWPQNLPKADAYSLLAEVLSEIEKLEDWKDVKDLKFMAEKIKQKHFSVICSNRRENLI